MLDISSTSPILMLTSATWTADKADRATRGPRADEADQGLQMQVIGAYCWKKRHCMASCACRGPIPACRERHTFVSRYPLLLCSSISTTSLPFNEEPLLYVEL